MVIVERPSLGGLADRKARSRLEFPASSVPGCVRQSEEDKGLNLRHAHGVSRGEQSAALGGGGKNKAAILPLEVGQTSELMMDRCGKAICRGSKPKKSKQSSVALGTPSQATRKPGR